MNRFAHIFVLAAALALPASAIAQSKDKASAQKVLRYAFKVAETGLDPAQVSDLYSSNVVANIFDPPLTYDFLARPVKVITNTAAELPKVSKDGLSWTIRIRPGIYFSDDPVFRGRKRELTAQDYVYSLKRHYDPKNKSPNLYLVVGKIPGLDALRQEAIAGRPFDYDREVEGLRVLDRYTYRIALTEPMPNLIYYLTYCNLMCAVAREVIEAAGDKAMERPVGTNAYRIAQWKRSSRLVLERNPAYREHSYAAQPPEDDEVKKAIAARLKGRRLPMIDRVEIYIIEEQQPRWLAFLNAEHDLIDEVPWEYIEMAVPNGVLAPNLRRQRIALDRVVQHDVALFYFGMENPVVGGYTPEKVALRRAITLAFDVDSAIRQFFRGNAIPAQSMVPPVAIGADASRSGPLAEYNPARAMALLDTFGYVDRDGDGYRDLPDGSPLLLELGSTPDSEGKLWEEIFRRSMDRVGLKIAFRKARWPELLKESRAGRLMMWRYGWTAAIPDADPFYVLLDGRGKGQANQSRFDLPQWNALYLRAQGLPHGEERAALYREMDRLFFAYAPIRPIAHRVITSLSHPWVVGYQRHPVMRELWKHLDIDEAAR